MRVTAPKLYCLIFVLVILTSGCDRYSRSTSGFSSLERTLLHDFRSQATLLANVFPAKQKLEAAFPGYQVLSVADVNRDGKDEYLLVGYRTVQGQVIQSALLATFDKDKPVTVEDFGQVYDNNCKTNFDSKAITASVIYFLPPPPNGKARFNVELYRTPCPAEGQPPNWQRVSGPR